MSRTYIFRVELNEARRDDSVIGFEWIEVLAVEPFKLRGCVPIDERSSAFCFEVVYVCRTEYGIEHVEADQLQIEVTEGIYREAA